MDTPGAILEQPYHMNVRCREANQPICESGERVAYLFLRTPQHQLDTSDHMRDGVWSGNSDTTGDLIIGTQHRVVNARMVRGYVVELRWG